MISRYYEADVTGGEENRRERQSAMGVMIVLLAAGFAQLPQVDVPKHEFIREWLLCGPFPNPLADGVSEYRHDETTLGYYIDYLEPIGGEEEVEPHEGLQFAAVDGEEYAWERHISPTDYVDLCKVYTQNQGVVAYAACALDLETEGEIVLGLGSNDGIKAWLNGQVIWDNHRPRAAEPDQDYVRCQVRPGPNLLLLKIDQGFGKWGFYARVVERAEKVKALLEEAEPQIEIEVNAREDFIEVIMGRTSRYLILDPIPACTIELAPIGQEPVQSHLTQLGSPVQLALGNLEEGPYWVEAVAHLPQGRQVAQQGFFHHGDSRLRLHLRERQGNPAPTHTYIQMLDVHYEVVPTGIGHREPGLARILRPDVSPFHIQVLLKVDGLGSRLYLADNEGKGYTVPKNRRMDLRLEEEVANSLRATIRRPIARKNSVPDWLREELKERLEKTKPGRRKWDSRRVYEVIDLLSTLKAALPSTEAVAVWYAPGVEKISRDEPVPAIGREGIYVELARNEFEPFQLVVRPEQDLNELSLDFSEFCSDSGVSLDTSRWTVHAVHFVPIATPSDFFGSIESWPDALPSLSAETTVKAGENTSLWVTVYVAKDQAAGIYNGRVTLCARGAEVARIPMTVGVFDFALPDQTHTRTAYGVHVNRQYHGPLTEAQVREVHDLYMQFCAAHRISPYTPHAGADFQIHVEGDPPQARVDFTAFDEAMAQYLDGFHFNGFNMGGLPEELGGHPRFSPEFNRLFEEAYGQIQEHLRKKGWLDEAYWYWVDEPPKERYGEVKEGMEFLKKACPDIRRLLTFHLEPAPVPYFYEAVNLWVPIMNYYDHSRAGERQVLGEEVWWYVCTGPKAPYPNNFIDHPAINHRVRFWMIDTFGLDGCLYWSITYWAQNPWEQAMSVSPEGGFWGNGDGRLVYPPRPYQPEEPVVEGPVSSIRMENLRDGLEDREYLVLLAQLGESHQSAREVLERVRRDLVQTLTCYEQNPIVFYASRHAVARAIEAGSGRSGHDHRRDQSP